MRNKEIKPRNTKPRLDITGQQFGYLTAEYWEKGKGWHCTCKCGNKTVVDTRNLRSGHTQSCGCKNYEPKNLKDLTGVETDNLIVLHRALNNNARTQWQCICKHCGKEFIAQTNRIFHQQSCGCVLSRNEANIQSMLDNANVEYAKQYTFADLYFKSKDHPLRFDFAIFENGQLRRLVEFNGLQHYTQSAGMWGESYHELLIRDKLKQDYCNKNGIDLKIIRYDDNYTLDDILY